MRWGDGVRTLQLWRQASGFCLQPGQPCFFCCMSTRSGEKVPVHQFDASSWLMACWCQPGSIRWCVGLNARRLWWLSRSKGIYRSPLIQKCFHMKRRCKCGSTQVQAQVREGWHQLSLFHVRDSTQKHWDIVGPPPCPLGCRSTRLNFVKSSLLVVMLVANSIWHG